MAGLITGCMNHCRSLLPTESAANVQAQAVRVRPGRVEDLDRASALRNVSAPIFT
jgi:hypothetical protein